jgi:hypothetical protein
MQFGVSTLKPKLQMDPMASMCFANHRAAAVQCKPMQFTDAQFKSSPAASGRHPARIAASCFWQTYCLHRSRLLQTYYVNRSQPPLFAAMVEQLVNHSTGENWDADFVLKCVQCLEVEHKYWTSAPKHVSVRDTQGSVHSMVRYFADWTHPRLESYRCAVISGLDGLYLALRG